MKAILEFDLNDIDDVEKHLQMINAQKMVAALQVFKDKLRSYDKYGLPEEYNDTIFSHIKDSFYEIINDYGLDEII